ncbi:hypothetical protein IT157_05705 [bacterium]|nr:hypothetical protein [bacterium]
MILRLKLTAFVYLFPALVWAQFQWPSDGVPIRQGAHLGWSGAAVAAGNDVALFYYDCLRDGTRDVVGNRISSDGSKLWGDHGHVISDAISEQRAPVAAAYSDGSTLVVWEDYSPGRFRDIMAQRYDASGTPMWNPAQGVAAVQTFRDQFDVKLALDDNGFAFLVFTDDRLTDGPDADLGAYAQVLTPDGNLVGPSGGIQLIDRVQGSNVPHEVVCEGDRAFVLCTIRDPGLQLVIQTIDEDGSIGFPDDESLISLSDYGQNHLARLAGGLALTWAHRAGEFDTDAKITLLDFNLNPLPDWNLEGVTVAGGSNTQAVVGVDESPDSSVVVMIADYEADADFSLLKLKKYSLSGGLVWGPVTIGQAFLRSSPPDWFWDGDDLVLVYVEQNEDAVCRVRSQKVSAQGELLWGSVGNELWMRDGKKARVNVEKPAIGVAQVVILSGRSVLQPESLFVGALSASGELAGDAQFVSGGWTYDSYDARSVRLDEQKLGVIWTDSRSRLERDVYFQFIDGQGTSLLEFSGRKLVSTSLYIYLPPAISSDGEGGAYVAWAGDSLDGMVVYYVHRVDALGHEVWSEPATVCAPVGFYGQPYFVPDDRGGVYFVYNRLDENFAARLGVLHVTSEGMMDWSGEYREFPGVAGTDVLLGGAIGDGLDGVTIAATTGPWYDTQMSVFHLNILGEYGAGWDQDGMSFGAAGERERTPRLTPLPVGALLTFERPQVSGGTYDIKGVVVGALGETPWGVTPRRLSTEGSAVTRHLVSEDGSGGFLLGWEDFRGGIHSQVFVARYNQNGIAQWEGIERGVCTNPMEQGFMTITHDGIGGAWVMWEDYRNSDIYPEVDVYAQHLDGETGFPATRNGFTWPEEGYPVCDVPTYQQQPQLLSWANGSAVAIWKDLRSSNPGRCCGAGAVGDIFQNIYAQVLSETSLSSSEPHELSPVTFDLTVSPNPFN